MPASQSSSKISSVKYRKELLESAVTDSSRDHTAPDVDWAELYASAPSNSYSGSETSSDFLMNAKWGENESDSAPPRYGYERIGSGIGGSGSSTHSDGRSTRDNNACETPSIKVKSEKKKTTVNKGSGTSSASANGLALPSYPDRMVQDWVNNHSCPGTLEESDWSRVRSSKNKIGSSSSSSSSNRSSSSSHSSASDGSNSRSSSGKSKQSSKSTESSGSVGGSRSSSTRKSSTSNGSSSGSTIKGSSSSSKSDIFRSIKKMSEEHAQMFADLTTQHEKTTVQNLELMDEVGKLRSEIKDTSERHEAQVQVLTNEIGQLRTECRKQGEKIEQLTSQNESLQRELATARKTSQELQDTIVRLERGPQGHEMMVAHQEHKFQLSEVDLLVKYLAAQFQQSPSRSKPQCSDTSPSGYSGSNSSSTSNSGSDSEDMEEFMRMMQEEAKLQKDRMAFVTTQHKAALAQNAELKSAIEKLGRDIVDQNARHNLQVQRLSSEITQLRVEKGQQGAKLEQLTTQAKNLQYDLSKEKESALALRQEIAQLTGSQNRERQLVHQLEKEKQTLILRINELQRNPQVVYVQQQQPQQPQYRSTAGRR
ncbi:hypothetical protein HDU98_001507, partial [Podochytrium sp. JEL0797]